MPEIQPRIFQLSVSNGGVPKCSTPEVEVRTLGITTDKQRNMEVHGGPERAVCLYSLELILALQGEGHPIYPGSTGENITTTGLDFSTLVRGARLQIGNEVILQIMSYTAPCTNIRLSFHDEYFNRMSQKLYPGWSRLYASVEQQGVLHIADPITLLS